MELPLVVRGCAQIGKSLRRFFATEILDEDNKYRCEKYVNESTGMTHRCKQESRAAKVCKISNSPNILCLLLKRFDMHGMKMQHHVCHSRTF